MEQNISVSILYWNIKIIRCIAFIPEVAFARGFTRAEVNIFIPYFGIFYVGVSKIPEKRVLTDRQTDNKVIL